MPQRTSVQFFPIEFPFRQMLVYMPYEIIIVLSFKNVYNFMNNDIFNTFNRLFCQFKIKPNSVSCRIAYSPLVTVQTCFLNQANSSILTRHSRNQTGTQKPSNRLSYSEPESDLCLTHWVECTRLLRICQDKNITLSNCSALAIDTGLPYQRCSQFIS
jgi:hypothetical protein